VRGGMGAWRLPPRRYAASGPMRSGVCVERDFTTRKVRWIERVMEGLLFTAAAAAIAVVLGIVYVVVSESAKFFAQVSAIEFLTSTTWTPLFDNPQYGIAPLLTGTFMSTLVALAVAVPLGLAGRDLSFRIRRRAHARDDQADA
jgi:hypothetical protein